MAGKHDSGLQPGLPFGSLLLRLILDKKTLPWALVCATSSPSVLTPPVPKVTSCLNPILFPPIPEGPGLSSLADSVMVFTELCSIYYTLRGQQLRHKCLVSPLGSFQLTGSFHMSDSG